MGILTTAVKTYSTGSVVLTSASRFNSKHLIAVNGVNNDLFYITNTDSGSEVYYGGNGLEEGNNAPAFDPIHYKTQITQTPTNEYIVYRATRGRNGLGNVVDSLSRRNISDGTSGVVPADATTGFTGGYKDFFAYRNVAGTTTRVVVIINSQFQIYNQNLSTKVNTRSIGSDNNAKKFVSVGNDQSFVLSEAGLFAIDVSAPGTSVPLIYNLNNIEINSNTCYGMKGLYNSSTGYLFFLHWSGSTSNDAVLTIRRAFSTGSLLATFPIPMPFSSADGVIGFDVHPFGVEAAENAMAIGTTQFSVLLTLKNTSVFGTPSHVIMRGLKLTLGTNQATSSIIDYGYTDLGGSPIDVSEYGHFPGYRTVFNGSTQSKILSYSFVQDAVIVSHTNSQTVGVGTNLTISVTATGDSLSYQWKKNGVNISGATSSSYVINNIQESHAGTYTCTVSNSVSTVNTGNIVITISTPISITSQPVSVIVDSTQQASFSVTVTGTSPTYQWKKNGVNISGATNSTYTIASPSVSDVALYSVTITNPSGTVNSNSVQLTFINSHPQTTQSILSGNSVHLSFDVTGGILSYQWKRNGVNISGATSSTLSIADFFESNAGTYTCVVNNGAVSRTSNDAILSIQTPGPINIVFEGGLANGFTVTSRQWFNNGIAISGQIGNTFTVSESQANGSNYFCELRNGSQKQVVYIYRVFNNKGYRIGLEYLRFLYIVNEEIHMID